MKILLRYSLLLLALVFIHSCSKDENNTVDCTNINPIYNNEIAPIFNANCATSGCHGPIFPASGIDLSNYFGARSASLNGKVLKSVKHESGAKAMPQNAAKLADSNIRLIECWIRNGAPE